MRNAQQAAFLAFLADAERREEDKLSRLATQAWDNVKRPIALDLAALAQNFRKARA